jgi:hypothetical protein
MGRGESRPRKGKYPVGPYKDEAGGKKDITHAENNVSNLMPNKMLSPP